ncbi:MAG TPA: SpaA isopeptide-forming pilin-related protein [Clostridia bacterium]|nr:SpaA isopeptide-forming pilin-related protein [Clostridia bacterium]
MIKKQEQIKKCEELKKRTEKILGKPTKVIRSISIFMLIIIVVNTLFSNNIVKAEYKKELDLYSKENIYCFKYKNYLYRSEYVVYNNDGKEYPAYCLNRELEGVSIERGGYQIEKNELIENNLIWRAIINGFPYKTFQELGCANEIEAYTATKMAVYDMMYNYNLEDFVPTNESGKRVVEAIKKISYEARKSTQIKNIPQIDIETEIDEWEVDEKENKYLSKTFKIPKDIEISEYSIYVDNTDLNNVKITDENNTNRKIFKKEEKFKIMVPIDELKKESKLKLIINSNVKTYPIYYGKAPNNLQNYAITGLETELISKNIDIKIPKNETNLVIKKVDSETLEPLKDFEFSICEVNTNKLQILTTDENGLISFKSIIPGEYIIKERKVQDNYILNEEEIKVNVKLNQNYNIVIENNKKIIENNAKLPRTGF